MTDLARHRSLSSLALAAILLVAPAGCGGGSTVSSADAALARTSERLMGEWVLVEFRPREQLDSVFGALLAAQIGHLTLRLDGQNLEARGVGIAARRTYRITGAEGDGFSAVVVEAQTIEYHVRGSFQGSELWFTSMTAPWQGEGRLVRSR